MSINFEISGIAEVIAALKKLPDKVINNVIRTTTFRGAQFLAKEIKAALPEVTGQLVRSVYADRLRTKFNVVSSGVKIHSGKGVPADKSGFYWKFHEYGTKHQRARGYIRNVFDSQGDKILQHQINEMAKEIEKQAKKLAIKAK